MALKKVKGSIDRIFDKNLQDLVRGIRNHKETEAQFVSQCIDEVKVELKQENVAVKANAVNKLIYLQMLGYDISWAAFNIIEVMSSPKFTFKRIGYLAASQCFHSETDVLMLTTNMIRKDLTSQNGYDAGIALNGLSCFITPDLARDLANDILALMSSIRPYTRKRAVLISYKIFLCYPEALRPAFPKLKEKLEDPDPGVQSAAVNVICELARKNPKNYLSLAPIFFKLMTTSTNNWVLIKIIKLFGALTPLEPRLGKKLIEPLTNLIHNTSAMSLLYECINTVVQGMQDHSSSIQLCVQKLRVLIEDSDQNLKYLGLLAMSRILKTHPKAVQAHKDLILQCLEDKDESIRLRALDLLFGMVSRKNLMEIVKKLMLHVEKADGSQYRDELILKIIEICSQNNFQYITNFEWYITVLVELTRIDGKSRHGSVVSNQLLDVCIRVKTIQEFAATQMASLLENAHAITAQLKRNGMQEVLYAAAYICGEFSKYLDRPDALIHAMLRPRVLSLPGHIQACYLQNVMKLYSSALIHAHENEDKEKIVNLTKSLLEKLPLLVQSSNLEVQERASCLLSMLKYIEKLQNKDSFQVEQFSCLFKGELNPVAPKAQRKVPVPQGLDLDAWINDPPSSSSDEEPQQTFGQTTYEYEDYSPSKKAPALTSEEIARRKEERAKEQASNPNYLMSQKGYQDPDAESDMNGIAEIDINVPLHVPGMSSSERYLRLEQERRRRKQAEKQVKKRKKKKKGKSVSDEDEDDIMQHHVVDVVTEEMPEGAVKTDSEDEGAKVDPHKALDIDLESPLAPSDALPRPRHHENRLKSQQVVDEKPAEAKKEKKKSKKTKKQKKKSHKSKAKVESLLVEEEPIEMPDEEPPTENGIEENNVEPDKVIDPSDDINFWLSTGDTQAAGEKNTKEEQVNNIEDEPTELETKPKKEKKHKRKKDGRKPKKEKENKQENKSEVEENIEEIPIKDELPRFKLLCENTSIKIEFSTQVCVGNNKKFGISLLISNLCQEEKIHGIEFDILDTLNTRLVRHDTKPIFIQFSLPPLSRNECLVEATSQSVIMPQRLRGSVNYSCGSDVGSLDFKLHVPCSTYLVPTPCSSHKFTELLSSGSVSDKSSIRITTNLNMDELLRKLCFVLKFSVVERIDESASLFVSSMQGHNICLLIKYISSSVINVDGKSDNLSLLSNVMDEVRTNIISTN